jgi:hypothetical protein
LKERRRREKMYEKSVQLPEGEWRRILNLLDEELGVWEAESEESIRILRTMRAIESQTGIRKKE